MYSIGDIVEVTPKKQWYPARIVKIETGKYFASCIGWEENDPDPFEESCIRPLAEDNEILIRKGGNIWVTIHADGVIRVGGDISGEFNKDGTVRKSGNIVGQIEHNGTIRQGGMITGKVEPSGDLRRSGSIIGNIALDDGLIRKEGSVWGSYAPANFRFRDRRAVTAVLVFFTPEFGY
jgi:cytoskeletal protein CcmA (bactofilin family)